MDTNIVEEMKFVSNLYETVTAQLRHWIPQDKQHAETQRDNVNRLWLAQVEITAHALLDTIKVVRYG